jgi:hypothetical protein
LELKNFIWSSLKPARGRVVLSKLALIALLGTGLEMCSKLCVDAQGEVKADTAPSRESVVVADRREV